MARNAPQDYDVRSQNTGALVVIGVPLAVARSEAARLNAEARVCHPVTGRPVGMQQGEVTTYEVTTRDGLIL